jgi:glutamate decarboxylase
MQNARYLVRRLKDMGCFHLLGEAELFPVVVVKAKEPDRLPLQAVATSLREYGWVVPAYNLPADADGTVVLRMVVRENMSRDMLDGLCQALERVVTRALHPSTPAGNRPIC